MSFKLRGFDYIIWVNNFVLIEIRKLLEALLNSRSRDLSCDECIDGEPAVEVKITIRKYDNKENIQYTARLRYDSN